jgi:YHS domain-containing protein
MKKAYLLVAFLIVTVLSFAQNVEVFSTKDGALQGYDAVSYFTDNKAVKGSKVFTLEWNGATWYFASKEHLNLFKATPEKYAPQYGGYCAYGVSDNHKAPTAPDAFTILNGKLYFNYNNKVKSLWLPEKEKRINTADSLWQLIKGDKP